MNHSFNNNIIKQESIDSFRKCLLLSDPVDVSSVDQMIAQSFGFEGDQHRFEIFRDFVYLGVFSMKHLGDVDTNGVHPFIHAFLDWKRTWRSLAIQDSFTWRDSTMVNHEIGLISRTDVFADYIKTLQGIEYHAYT